MGIEEQLSDAKDVRFGVKQVDALHAAGVRRADVSVGRRGAPALDEYRACRRRGGAGGVA